MEAGITRLKFFLTLSLFLLLALPVSAQDVSSTNFSITTPNLFLGAYATSTTYGLTGVLTQPALGTSTATSFGNNPGFLFYPFVSSPVVSATPGNAQVTLNWTASSAGLGWSVGAYEVGQSSVSGGPYSFTNVGNVLTSTQTGLSNGTPYYFILRVLDAFSNVIASSSEVTSTPAGAAAGGGSSGGGGGGGGGGGATPIINTGVILKGYSYPAAKITVLKDGALATTLNADGIGDWSTSMGVNGGIYTFSIYATDSRGYKSVTISFTINVPVGQIVTLSDIVVSPTIAADKSQVKVGNDITFFGSAYPQSDINVIINSEQTIVDKTKADKFGRWLYKLDSGVLELGEHTTKSQTVIPNQQLISSFSESLAFRVGNQDVTFGDIDKKQPGVCSTRGDINNDKKINIVDFSIMLYFWNERNPKNPCVDINRDGIVNLFDFSIMLYWWTG